MVGITIFVSAFLLFMVQLMAGKAALPRFGGNAAVWTASLFVFQLLLLLGYAYAHALTSRVPRRAQRWVHAVIATAAAAWLITRMIRHGSPFAANAGTATIDLLGVLVFLASSVGAPFFVLSATGPLLQAWNGEGHRRSQWGYYALSNAGSLLALAVYPLAIEPTMGLRLQTVSWAAIFGVWAIGLVATGFTLLGVRALGTDAKNRAEGATQNEVARERGVTGRTALTWMFLAGLATVLLSSVSNVLSQDVTPTPLLWALPLAIYLASLIIAFGGPDRYRPLLFGTLFCVGLAGVGLGYVMAPDVSLLQTVFSFCLLQLAASVLLHGELYRRRPHGTDRSTYYLCMCAGGVAGALFVSGLAPAFFSDFTEFPLVVGLICAGIVASTIWRSAWAKSRTWGAVGVCLGLFAAMLVAQRLSLGRQTLRLRNFFGVLRVDEVGAPGDDSHAFVLRHGTTTHGMQFTSAERRDEPSTYYTSLSGLSVGLDLLRDRRPGHGLEVAVLGLGVGTVAALLDTGDSADFYEIDANVIRLALGEGGFFHYLDRSRAVTRIKFGDARQLLVAELQPNMTKRDLMVVDVFTGDSVPAHLFTVEAMDLFWRHLEDDGLLALHVSSRYLDLAAAAMGIARDRRLHAVVVASGGGEVASRSTWVLVAKDAALLEHLPARDKLSYATSVPNQVRWTDDYLSVLPVLRRAP